MTLYILNYNNYYNRIIKKENTFSDYASYIIYGPVQGVYGFTPGDGVNTTQILGSNVQMYNGQGDYLLAITESGDIDSRWFIIDTKRERNGQWTLTLRRDLIAEFYNQVLESPMFIEKATLPSSSPLIFNSEQMTFNQIKKSETLIKDKSNCPWIIGYYAKNTENKFLSGTVARNNLNDTYDIEIDVPFDNWIFNATTNPFVLSPSEVTYRVYGMNLNPPIEGGLILQNGYLNITKEGKFTNGVLVSNLSTPLDFLEDGYVNGRQLADLIRADKYNIYSQAKAYINPTSDEDTDYFLNLGGKIVKDSLGAYYQLSISPSTVETKVTDVGAGSLFNTLSDFCKQVPKIIGTPNTTSFKIYTKAQTYTMSAVELTGFETTWNMTGNKLTTEDAPYNIFAIPYGQLTVTLNDNPLVITSAEIGIATATSMIQTMSSSLYDIQLLPYCPLILDTVGILDLKSSEAYSLVQTGGETPETLGIILNIPYSRFTKNIYLDQPVIINNTKVENECDMYKLCSPNWSSEYQFNAAKNNGIQYFNIDCEYKPFTPYIHVNPNFGGLYGQDFNDARGLILSGDFSLTQIKDQWQQYQLQNKNFQNNFDRQIQHMEVTQKYKRIGDIASAITGTGSGAAAGALAGSLIPGLGTGIGAAVGGAFSAAAGIADVAISDKLRNEAIDYTKDQFGYQLGNIQALPYTLTKVSSFNNNNKLFPVLEYYTCTDVEKEALANKIAYNGMSVGVIGTINQFIENKWSYTINNKTIESKGYIKGQLIRLEGTEDDYHLVNSLAGELNKGVYIK